MEHDFEDRRHYRNRSARRDHRQLILFVGEGGCKKKVCQIFDTLSFLLYQVTKAQQMITYVRLYFHLMTKNQKAMFSVNLEVRDNTV